LRHAKNAKREGQFERSLKLKWSHSLIHFILAFPALVPSKEQLAGSIDSTLGQAPPNYSYT
jgi:hypothetical protein